MSPPSTPRTRLYLTLCVGLCALLGATAWLIRDLPRRLVAAALADRLAAKVTLDHLAIDGKDQFRLVRLRIEDLHDYPFVKSLHFDEILIQAELGGILESRFERWQLRGGVARLVPTEWSPPPRRPLPHIHELILEPAEVQVVFGAQETSITAQAKLQDQTYAQAMEASYHGEVLLRADTLALAPWLALFDPSDPPPIEGHLADFETVWRLETGAIKAGARHLSTRHVDQTLGLIEPKLQVTPGDPEVGVELVAEQAKLDFAGQTTAIEELRLVASTTATATGTLQMQLHPFFDGLRSGELDVEW
ncbi:MAG: hypothetical protein AAF657_12895, partial [Acidobacteriota bacterium]